MRDKPEQMQGRSTQQGGGFGSRPVEGGKMAKRRHLKKCNFFARPIYQKRRGGNPLLNNRIPEKESGRGEEIQTLSSNKNLAQGRGKSGGSPITPK